MNKPYLLLVLSAGLVLASCGNKAAVNSSQASSDASASATQSSLASETGGVDSSETSSSSSESVSSSGSSSSSEESSSSEGESSSETSASSSESVSSSGSSSSPEESSSENSSNSQIDTYTSIVKYDFSKLENSNTALNKDKTKAIFANAENISSGTDIIDSVTNASNISAGYEVSDLKLAGLRVGGKSSGTLSVTLTQSICKIVLNFYNSTSSLLATVKINDTSTYECVAADTLTPVTKDFIFAESSDITFAITKRIVITSMEFFTMAS